MKELEVSHRTRNHTLDVIRGIAVLLIIFHHVTLPKRLPLLSFSDKLFGYLLKLFAPFNLGGWIGVDLFFVLSGFLVSGLLFNEYKKSGTINIKQFIIRRGFKIYPGFFFFIGFTFIAEKIIGHYTSITVHPGVDYLKDLFFLNNYTGGRWAQTWSLDVEEFFYLFLPGLFYFLIRFKKINIKTMTYIYIFLLAEGVIFRAIAVYSNSIFDLYPQYYRTHFRLDGLFLGVLLSYVYNFQPEILVPIYKRKYLFLAISLIPILMNFVLNRQNNIWEAVVMLAINPIAFAILLVLALNYSTNIKSKFMEKIGRNSYSIYLWHYVFVVYSVLLVNYMDSKVTSFSGTVDGYSYKILYLTYLVAYLAFAVPIGLLFAALVEVPFIKIRDRFFPSKSKIINMPKHSIV